ncbi:hypothetical protein MYMAC_006605 [Corallococcus macrosporus DSM 14697]|uniref:Uncharacterized protein n=1 Tax=Corallococcus macrosporus DSM 14697 TaxID=1189310 RepID=A0A250K4N9_9BACT|nr:hypothetical protein MYMAC_006605 [Corallococcus macrosporus DSM 14697]
MSTDAMRSFTVTGTLPRREGGALEGRPMPTEAVRSITAAGALPLSQGGARTGVTHVH